MLVYPQRCPRRCPQRCRHLQIKGLDRGRAIKEHPSISSAAHDIIIAVASHKAYPMPADPMYMPVQVGAALHRDLDFGWLRDDTGDNISALNGSYSELTAMYWIWKNVDASYKGLVHYRRHFASKHPRFSKQAVPAQQHEQLTCAKHSQALKAPEPPVLSKHPAHRRRFARIIGQAELAGVLAHTPVVVPKPRNYYIETIYSHYSHTFHGEQLDLAREIIAAQYPDYLAAFDRQMAGKTAHMFNMFVMRSDIFDSYCTWLFALLEQLCAKLDPARYNDAFQARWPGRVSERLLDVWLQTKKQPFCELDVVNTEPINWIKKSGGFLLAKAGIKKYRASF